MYRMVMNRIITKELVIELSPSWISIVAVIVCPWRFDLNYKKAVPQPESVYSLVCVCVFTK